MTFGLIDSSNNIFVIYIQLIIVNLELFIYLYSRQNLSKIFKITTIILLFNKLHKNSIKTNAKTL